jgi:hypothetical protein
MVLARQGSEADPTCEALPPTPRGPPTRPELPDRGNCASVRRDERQLEHLPAEPRRSCAGSLRVGPCPTRVPAADREQTARGHEPQEASGVVDHGEAALAPRHCDPGHLLLIRAWREDGWVCVHELLHDPVSGAASTSSIRSPPARRSPTQTAMCEALSKRRVSRSRRAACRRLALHDWHLRDGDGRRLRRGGRWRRRHLRRHPRLRSKASAREPSRSGDRADAGLPATCGASLTDSSGSLTRAQVVADHTV